MSSTLAHETKLVSDIQKCMKYIEQNCTDVKAIFRVPGHQQNVSLLQKYFDSGTEGPTAVTSFYALVLVLIIE